MARQKSGVPDEYKCPNCDLVFARKSDVNRHAQTHKKHEERDVQHICLKCGVNNHQRSRILEHIAAYHFDLKWVVCEICHETLKQPSSLSRHRKEVHGVPKASGPRIPVRTRLGKWYEPIINLMHERQPGEPFPELTPDAWVPADDDSTQRPAKKRRVRSAPKESPTPSSPTTNASSEPMEATPPSSPATSASAEAMESPPPSTPPQGVCSEPAVSFPPSSPPMGSLYSQPMAFFPPPTPPKTIVYSEPVVYSPPYTPPTTVGSEQKEPRDDKAMHRAGLTDYYDCDSPLASETPSEFGDDNDGDVVMTAAAMGILQTDDFGRSPSPYRGSYTLSSYRPYTPSDETSTSSESDARATSSTSYQEHYAPCGTWRTSYQHITHDTSMTRSSLTDFDKQDRQEGTSYSCHEYSTYPTQRYYASQNYSGQYY